MKKAINLLTIFLIICNFYIWQNVYKFKSSNNLEIFVLNVGQGDSILIKTPDNKYGLIDGGKGKVVLDELDSVMGIFNKELEFAVFTHPDADHIEGLNFVLDNYKIKNIFIHKYTKDSAPYKSSLQKINNLSSTNFQIYSENDFRIGEIYFDILWPIKDRTGFLSEQNSNDTSIAFLLSYNNFTFFSGGDLSTGYELNALKQIKSKEVDVLKVGHHGSKTSTGEEIFKLVSFNDAIISVGKNNSYNHPATEVLNILENNKVKIYRTDLNGRIQITSDGNNYEVKKEF